MTIHLDPALQNRQSDKSMPYMTQNKVYLAKVIAWHPSTGTADVALDGTPGQGGIYRDCPVASWTMGSQTGESYFPTLDLASPVPSAHGPFDQPIDSSGQNVWCIVGHLDNRAQRAIILGFLNRLDAQARSSDVGDKLSLHESGIYSITTQDGTLQIGLPDGSSILISTSSTPVDMTAKNSAWNPKTTPSPYQINITVQGPVTIDAPEVYLGDSQGNGQAVARVGDSVNLTTGIIESGSSKVFSG